MNLLRISWPCRICESCRSTQLSYLGSSPRYSKSFCGLCWMEYLLNIAINYIASEKQATRLNYFITKSKYPWNAFHLPWCVGTMSSFLRLCSFCSLAICLILFKVPDSFSVALCTFTFFTDQVDLFLFWVSIAAYMYLNFIQALLV